MKNFLNKLANPFVASTAANDTHLSESEIRQAIRELKAMNDRELDDLGLARADIEHAVRHGRAGIDDPQRVA